MSFFQALLTGSGYDVFIGLGDSTMARTDTVSAPNQPLTGKALEYDFNTNTLVAFGASAYIAGYSSNTATIWAKFAREYYIRTRRIPIIINCGADNSTLSAGSGSNNWVNAGTNWPRFTTAYGNIATLLPGARIKGVLVSVGINDVQNLNGTAGVTVAQLKTNIYDFHDRVEGVVGSSVPISYIIPGRAGAVVSGARLKGMRNNVRQLTIDRTTADLGATFSYFTNSAFWMADLIHQNATGNLHLGMAYCRRHTTFKNIVSKHARFICSAHDLGDGDMPLADAAQIALQFSDATNLARFLRCEYFYCSQGGKYQYGTGTNAALDWTGMCGPAFYGGFTLGGSAPNYFITFNGTTTYFDDGLAQSTDFIFCTTTNFTAIVRIAAATTPQGTVGCAFGAGNMFLKQLPSGSGNGLYFNVFKGTPLQWTGDLKLQVASYLIGNNNAGHYLFKNGVYAADANPAGAALVSGRSAQGGYFNVGVPGTYSEGWSGSTRFSCILPATDVPTGPDIVNFEAWLDALVV